MLKQGEKRVTSQLGNPLRGRAGCCPSLVYQICQTASDPREIQHQMIRFQSCYFRGRCPSFFGVQRQDGDETGTWNINKEKEEMRKNVVGEKRD